MSELNIYAKNNLVNFIYMLCNHNLIVSTFFDLGRPLIKKQCPIEHQSSAKRVHMRKTDVLILIINIGKAVYIP